MCETLTEWKIKQTTCLSRDLSSMPIPFFISYLFVDRLCCAVSVYVFLVADVTFKRIP